MPYALHYENPRMVRKRAEGDRFNWQLPLYAAAATSVLCLLTAVSSSDGILYLVVVVPIISLLSLSILVAAAIHKDPRLCLSILSALGIYWAISAGLVTDMYSARVRGLPPDGWYGRSLQDSVLAQPDANGAYLKHIEWDGWASRERETRHSIWFLTLQIRSQRWPRGISPGSLTEFPARFLSCVVSSSHWYAVLFYTDEGWGKSKSDCGTYD